MSQVSNPFILAPLLVFIIVAEEAIWRGAIMLPLTAKLGAWKGIVLASLAFAGAHAFIGPPLLVLAAFIAGMFWGILVVRTQGLFAAIVCHLLWDVTVMFLLPLH